MNQPGAEKAKKKKTYRIYHIVYAAMAAVFILMLVWAAAMNWEQSPADRLTAGNIDFAEGWYLEDGSAADPARLHKLPSVEPYRETGIFHRLPENLGEGLSLCFRTKNIFYKVYVDGELRYEPQVQESRIYNKTLGTRWNYVPLYGGDAGKTVEIRFYTVYGSARASVDHLRLGSAAGEIVGTFTGKAVAFSTCLLLIFAGILLIIADIPANLQMNKNHELLYLGLFSISIAIWCLAETNLMQFYTDDSRLLQIVACCSLMLIPIPLMLYLDAAFGFKHRMVMPVVSGLSAAEFVLCTILHFAGILDYHETLSLTHVILGISAFILLYTIMKNAFQMGKSKIRNVYKVLRTAGLVSISFATAIDIVRFYRGNNGDSAMFVRIGLLVFILCYGSSSLEKTINAVRLGIQSEFVSQLAYRDGLTGIGNRTAFQERLVELEKEKQQQPGIAIIMFDVNDLKYVNDHLGHQKGDQMLVCSADIIKAAVEPVEGACYRIGGDEFVVILNGEDVEGRCERAVSAFREGMEQYNAVKDQPFRISIASGYAVYDKGQEDEMLMDVYQQADVRMYENKKQIKSAQVRPEEYYAGRG